MRQPESSRSQRGSLETSNDEQWCKSNCSFCVVGITWYNTKNQQSSSTASVEFSEGKGGKICHPARSFGFFDPKAGYLFNRGFSAKWAFGWLDLCDSAQNHTAELHLECEQQAVTANQQLLQGFLIPTACEPLHLSFFG